MRKAALRSTVLAIAGVLVAAGPAQGATVSVDNGVLRIATTAPGKNVVDVVPDGFAYRIHDSRDVLVAPDCVTITEFEAVCGGSIMSIRIDGGGGEDLLGLWDVPVPVTATGGAGADLIETGSGADVIDAGPGQDAVDGRDGDDAVEAGADRDRVDGGDGDDELSGEDGADVLRGGSGEDDVTGGAGTDLVDGGAGDDTLAGGEGTNTLVADEGTDTVTTDSSADSVVSPRRFVQRPRCRRTRRAKRLRCVSTRVRAQVRRRAAPVAWPPATRSGVQAVASRVQVDVIARWPGTAHYLSVTVKVKRTKPVRVCVRIWDRSERFLGRFPARVDTKKDSIKSPSLSVHSSKAKLKKRGCKRSIP